jgi:hypothetical protein
VPSKFLAHRHAVQYWLHVSHGAWFAPLLPEFRCQGPRQRLQSTTSLYGLHKTAERGTSTAYTLAFLGNRDTTGTDRKADFPFSKERWHRKVHDAVEDAATRHLQTKAAERHLPGPETVTKRNGPLKLLPRLNVREGGELAKCGVVFRQCTLSGRFQPWDNRHEQPCPHCHSPYKFGDPCNLLVCAGAPPAFAAARSAAPGRVTALEARGGPVKLLYKVPTSPSPRSAGTGRCTTQWRTPPPGTSRPRRLSATCRGPRLSPSGTARSSFCRALVSGKEASSPSAQWLVFCQCTLSGRFQPWDNRHEQPCPHCHSPYKFGDPCHLLVCAGAPPAFAAARSAALGRVAALEARGGPVKLLCDTLVGESTQVPALRSVAQTRGVASWVWEVPGPWRSGCPPATALYL